MELKEISIPNRFEYNPLDTNDLESEVSIIQFIPKDKPREIINEIHQ